MAIGVGEHTEPMLTVHLGQAELYAVVAASPGNRIVRGARAGRAVQWGRWVQEIIETAESPVDSLARVYDDEGLATRSRGDRGVFNHVIEAPTIPAGFKRQNLGKLVVDSEHGLMLLVGFESRSHTFLIEAASRAACR